MRVNLPVFWSRLRRTEQGWVHPDDLAVLSSVSHSFNLDYPPPAYVGDIVNAPIIVLAANGGYHPEVTPREFPSPDEALNYLERLANPSGVDWRQVAPYYHGINYAEMIFSGQAALVNACAYRSAKISDEPENRQAIKRLPSARIARQWLLEDIYPMMEEGKRLVIGKRHGLWNLPAFIKVSRGFIADPAPISPHLSAAVMTRIRAAGFADA